MFILYVFQTKVTAEVRSFEFKREKWQLITSSMSNRTLNWKTQRLGIN
jgi:hypothetical protein